LDVNPLPGVAGAVCVRVLPVVVAIAAAGCRSSISTKNLRSGAHAEAPAGEPPRGEPVEVPGSLATAREGYQSRGIIALDVKSSAIQLGDEFSLVNETTGAALIEQEQPKLALAGADESGWYLDGYDVTLRIYLLNPDFAQSFAPGTNNLRLHVSSAGDETGRVAKASVTLRDFPVFGGTIGAYESGEQRSRGFEGGFTPFGNSTVSSKGKSLLMTGLGNIVDK
jgi:hypothetical protein